MTDYELIKKALSIARESHQYQKDKGGDEYIYHPITVSLLCNTPKEKAVALLHDVLEDTAVTYETLKEEMGEEIADAVQLLTFDHSMEYLDYVRMIKNSGNTLAIAVKKADLTMNMDLSRIPNPTQQDLERIVVKYKPALAIINGTL